ncbi:MAG: TfoX/Sxy family protein [Bacilli bacterium]
MASDLDYVLYVVEQLKALKPVTYRKMMGEYIIYVQGIYIMTVADNELYLKPTEEVIPYLKEVIKRPFYKGGKANYLIRDIDDDEYLCLLAKVTLESINK